MKSWIIIGVLISLMSGAAYFYYSTTQSRIGTLIAEGIALQKDLQTAVAANEQNVQAIDDLQLENQRVLEDFNRVNTEYQDTRVQNSKLVERLGQHELDALASAKPVLVERIINNASENVSRCFEIMTGSPLTDREIQATSGNQFNSECPWLWNGSVNND